MNGLVGFGKGLAKGAWSAAKGTVEGLGDLAKGGWSLATDPAARAQARQTASEMARRAGDYASQVREDPAKALRDARDGANRLYSEFDRARQEAAARGESAEFWGNAAGQVGFEVGTALIPVGALSKAAKLRKAARAADGFGDAAHAMSAGKRAKAIRAGAAMPDAPVCVQGCKSGKLAPAKPARPVATVPRDPRLNPSLDKKWFGDDGALRWPDGTTPGTLPDGFAHPPVAKTLKPGDLVDRYGSTRGNYLSPVGEPFSARALPYDPAKAGTAALPYKQYRVIKDLPVQSGTAAPWFDEIGGAVQHKTGHSIEQLLKDGFLEEIGGSP